MILRRTIQGMTLLEILLVFLIMTTLFLLSFQFYRVYQADNQVARIQFNVDLLFKGLNNYYHRQCRGIQQRPSQSYDGTLNPKEKSIKTPYVIDIDEQLIKTNYIINWNPQANSIIDLGVGKNGYFAQLNYTTSTRNIYTCFQKKCSALQTITAPVSLWKARIAIKLRDELSEEEIVAYQKLLGASCVSDKNETEIISCAAKEKGKYLVWERMLPVADSYQPSSYWLSNPRVKEFNMQYTNDPMYDLNNPIAGTSDYYLCGG